MNKLTTEITEDAEKIPPSAFHL